MTAIGEPTLVGRTIGSYKVVAEVGRGGMGAVYLAEHPLIGRKVAIKVLLGEVSKNADNVARFFNEARAIASIRHPALVDVFDFGTLPEGSAYIVMDYLDGETVSARLESRGRLAPGAAVAIARQVASGMAVAHGKGIIHRDLKPDNVFLLAEGGADAATPQVKILDFGIAKLTGDQVDTDHQRTRTGILLGTPLYMSPEQCRGAGSVDNRTDIYSLGCIMYAMLTGAPPFTQAGSGELIAAHLYQPPSPLRGREPSVPGELERVVMRLLAKQPEDRQQTMAELVAELDRLPVGVLARTEPERRTPIMPPPAATPTPGVGGTMLFDASPDLGRQAGGRAPAERGGRGRDPAAPRIDGPQSDTLEHSAIARTGSVAVPTRRRAAPMIAIGGGIAAVAVVVALVIGIRAGNHASPSSEPAAAAAPAAVEAPAAAPASTAAPMPAAVAVVVPAPPASAPAPPAASVKDDDRAVALARAGHAAPRSASGPTPAAAAPDQITVTASNARPGLTVRVDGRKTSLPLKLPKDGKSHTLRFETPDFEPETLDVRATRDRHITLKNRPFLLLP